MTTFGSQGTGNGQVQAGAGLLLDGKGNLSVADWQLNRIQKFRLLPPLVPR